MAEALVVLIDDDELVHLTWKIAFSAKGREVKTFHSLEEFMAAQPGIPPECPVYIDVSLANGVRGEDVAHALFAKGYKTLHLATGHDKDSIEKPPWVLSVQGKEPPT